MVREGYTRNYLDNGMWSNNDDWDEIARTVFKVFLILYLLPPEMLTWLEEHYDKKNSLPNKRTFNRNLPD